VTRTLSLALLAAALAAPPAAAHESAERARGVVEAVTAERLVVKAGDGHSLAFRLTPGTRFSRGDEPARPGDVRVGERAVVEGRRAGGEVEAVRVRLGPLPGRGGGRPR
jgi:hypothetical protein